MPRALGQIDARKSEAIITAAFAVLAERGLSAPLEEVARRANVSKQTVYNHYGSKGQLLQALVERRRDEITAALRDPAALDDPKATLTSYAAVMIRSILTEPYGEIMRIAIAGSLDAPELADIIYETAFMGARQTLANYLAALDAKGALRVPDPLVAAEMFAGIAVGGLQLRMLIGRAIEDDLATETARAQMLVDRVNGNDVLACAVFTGDVNPAIGLNHPHAVLVKEPEQQAVGRQPRIDQFVFSEGAEQRVCSAPGFFCRATGVVRGDVLDHDAPGPPDLPFGGLGGLAGEPDPGRGLFGLGEIALGAKGECFTFDRNDALIPVLQVQGVDRHDEQPLPEKSLSSWPGEPCRRLGHLEFVELAVASERAVCVVVAHDIAHRTVALGLNDEAALKLQTRPHEGGQRAGLGKQIGDRFGVFVSRQDIVDHRPQADQPASNLLTVQLEDNSR
eukprot:gene9216-9297_t